MITKEQKQEWIRALESGEWKQGRGKLKSGDKYCCLGVAKYLFGLPRRSDFLDGPEGGVTGAFLPEDVQRDLISMNDAGRPFPKIAKWIKRNVRAE